MPYISATIIFQLLTVVIPQLEALKKEGEQGQKKINQWSRYATVVSGVLPEPTLMATALEGGSVRSGSSATSPAGSFKIFTALITLTCGYGLHHVVGRTGHRTRNRQRNLARSSSLGIIVRHSRPGLSQLA